MNDRKIKYATICSGIECCSVALRGMNWEPVFFAEIDRNPSLILRRITPFEAERLMGLPDGYTLVPGDRWRRSSEEERRHVLSHCPEYDGPEYWRTKNGKPQTRLIADAARYKACGNGWATNCARWILRRIDEIERR